MGQRARILTQVTGFRGWKVADAYWESAGGQQIEPVGGYEVPDDAVDRQQIDPVTGQYQAAPGAGGLQTNNPGWPGFSSEGWLFGGGVRLSFLF